MNILDLNVGNASFRAVQWTDIVRLLLSEVNKKVPALTIGNEYTRVDIVKLFDIPNATSSNGSPIGKVSTGLFEHEGHYFVFATLETSGSTGHDYENKFISNKLLQWVSQNSYAVDTPSIKKLIASEHTRHIFTRKDKKTSRFVYHGHGVVEKIVDEKPVKIIWDFSSEHKKNKFPVYPDDLPDDSIEYLEGKKKIVFINTYERNSDAREACIVEYGDACFICGFEFGEVYGNVCEGLIHVHHLKMISKNDNEYVLNPITDLRPVCPNCHMVLHSKGKNECYAIEDVKAMLGRVATTEM